MTESDNLRLLQPCTMDEVKRAVELLDQDSAAGADGYTGRFYRSCWDIICEDLLQAVHEFMAGVPIPRSVASTLIVLLPKKPSPSTFGDSRPLFRMVE